MRINLMSLSNIHFDLKELLSKAIEKKEYGKAMKLLEKLLGDSSSPFQKEEINGILFVDVKELVKTKEDLENILLSTKVIFETKEELLEFFEMLLNYGYKESAISYFEEILANVNDYELIDGFNALLK
jgi:type IV secretory pathway component VirB8